MTIWSFVTFAAFWWSPENSTSPYRRKAAHGAIPTVVRHQGTGRKLENAAERCRPHVFLARNLLGTLRNRELAQAAKDIAVETGLVHRPVANGQRVAGIYRRSVMLASGRHAMLDDGMGFSLVPWKPVIEQRLGQQLAAAVRGGSVSWMIGRQRTPSI